EHIDGPSRFFRLAHQRIYAAMRDLLAAHVPIDLVTLSDELRRHGQLEDVGGPAYIAAPPDAPVGLRSNVGAHALTGRRYADARASLATLQRAQADLLAGDHDVYSVLDRVAQDVFTIAHPVCRGGFVAARDFAPECFGVAVQRGDSAGRLPGISTGIAQL